MNYWPEGITLQANVNYSASQNMNYPCWRRDMNDSPQSAEYDRYWDQYPRQAYSMSFRIL